MPTFLARLALLGIIKINAITFAYFPKTRWLLQLDLHLKIFLHIFLKSNENQDSPDFQQKCTCLLKIQWNQVIIRLSLCLKWDFQKQPITFAYFPKTRSLLDLHSPLIKFLHVCWKSDEIQDSSDFQQTCACLLKIRWNQVIIRPSLINHEGKNSEIILFLNIDTKLRPNIQKM